ncbi:helix-turn-helix transcriptional regulator [Paenibacillus sp. JDR-2]|uniref:helix-turn-helix transcriptional regulator n=1 Tax=Paenibacillus sp. (strain JDR-2) TaxID=324057 RepID=UPI0001663FE1|nr:AraC family transcriptional regulator [Paenibacillus sp. JDR-2]ACT02711.1 transcriptional regulator, AraC family [Paenibacillus sp. JDR-2]
MLEMEPQHLIKVNKIATIVHQVTKLDVRVIDRNGHTMLEWVSHQLPACMTDLSAEYGTILACLDKNPPGSYFYYVNTCGLEFIAAAATESADLKTSYVLLGPFLSSNPDSDFISGIIYLNRLPIGERKVLQEFYRSLRMISSNEGTSLGDLLVQLCAHEPVDARLITTDIQTLPPVDKEQQRSDIADNYNIIDIRYRYEKTVMNAITKGDTTAVKKMVKEAAGIFELPDRFPESPIRSAKNLLIVSNTICRIAAERGGMKPMQLHTISERFAIMIERASNLPHIKKIGERIMIEYCEAVKEDSTKQYSISIRKAVDYISLHLDQPLTLSGLAETVEVSASHLSRQFKLETGMGFTDYVNWKRIEESKLYLQSGTLPITDIAFLVGFNDLNYFGRVFKKYTDRTPSQYVHSLFK